MKPSKAVWHMSTGWQGDQVTEFCSAICNFPTILVQ